MTLQRRILTGFIVVVTTALLTVLVAQVFTGCWVDVGNEMGDQPSVGYVEPPRSSAPDEAVPFSGPDVPPGGGVPANPVSRTAVSEERGFASYVLFCTPCHGEAAGDPAPGHVGALFSPPPPHLADVVGARQDGEIFLAVSTGFGRMPALASRMSAEERWHLVNYLRGLVAGEPGPAADSALLRGAQVFSVQCAGCHGPAGEGALGPGLHPSSLLSESASADILALLQAGRPSRGMPAFGGRLSQGELDDLVVLLKELQAGGSSVLQDSLARLRQTTTTVAPPATTSTTASPSTTSTTASSGGGTTTTAPGPDPAVIALGQKVYGNNCVGCHGVDGSGGIGSVLKPSTFISAGTDEAVREVIEKGRAGTAMPNWGGRLSADEITAVVVLLRSWQGPSAAGATEAGAEPVAPPFTHRAHLAQGVSCLFCHSSAMRGPSADLPPLELCVGCHRWISTTTDATQAVLDAFDNGTEVGWDRVYDVPDFVFFSHQPHVAVAKVSCTECHGDVASMTLATKAERLTMGFCLDCHKKQPERERLLDCQICHK